MQSVYGTMSVEVPMKAVGLVLVDLELETFGSPSEKIGISYLSMRLRGCLGCGAQGRAACRDPPGNLHGASDCPVLLLLYPRHKIKVFLTQDHKSCFSIDTGRTFSMREVAVRLTRPLPEQSCHSPLPPSCALPHQSRSWTTSKPERASRTIRQSRQWRGCPASVPMYELRGNRQVMLTPSFLAADTTLPG